MPRIRTEVILHYGCAHCEKEYATLEESLVHENTCTAKNDKTLSCITILSPSESKQHERSNTVTSKLGVVDDNVDSVVETSSSKFVDTVVEATPTDDIDDTLSTSKRAKVESKLTPAQVAAAISNKEANAKRRSAKSHAAVLDGFSMRQYREGCRYCGKEVSTGNGMRMHMHKFHIDLARFPCPKQDCRAPHWSMNGLSRHLHQKHAVWYRKYIDDVVAGQSSSTE